MRLSESLYTNKAYFDKLFKDCGDFVSHEFDLGDTKVYIAYIDMMTNRETIDKHIVEPILRAPITNNLLDYLKKRGLSTADVSETDDIDEICNAVLTGDTAIITDAIPKALVISTKGFPNRGIPSAEIEVVVLGSKEAFSEVFRFNTALLRRRIRDTRLKVKQVTIGTRSRTDIAVVYLDDIARRSVVRDILRDLNEIRTDAIFDSGYISQFIESRPFSLFPQTQVTERPDKASAAIMEGRIVIVVDNSPFVVIVPATLTTFFQSSEDYYEKFQIMTFLRALRYACAFIAATLPAFYIAALYNPSEVSALLVFKMAQARAHVPVPAALEVLLMDIGFELIREASIRLPSPIGSTLGIVGGIIVGQAAVEAGLVSPIVVIIISLTGIAGFAIPNVSFVASIRLVKYFLILSTWFLGMFGFYAGVLVVLTHLASLSSFGIPYIFPICSSEVGKTDLKDTIFRAPLFHMKKRPFFAAPANNIRQGGEDDDIIEQ
ncbi:spore germination protein [Clostridia bacterium]|nr:spore germination protein [Clostridia bacterium]